MPVNSFIDYPMSWKPNRADLKRPVYLSLAQKLEQDISSGVLPPGTQLPPQRELADYLDLNFTTVTRAYKLCEQKGLLYGRIGSGTFVSPNAFQSLTISAPQSDACVDLAFMASFEQCNRLVTDAAKKAARKPYFPQLLSYDDPTGMPHHIQAALQWMAPFGIEAEEDHVAIASGGLNALAVSLVGLFAPGDRIAVDFYSFANFIELAKMLHIRLVPIRGDDEGMSAEELEMQCSIQTIRGVFLMPSCCNPTTVMISHRRKQQLSAVIERFGLILLEDDPHIFMMPGIVEDYRCPLSALVPDRSIFILSLSKAMSSGLRVAFMVLGKEVRQAVLDGIFNINVKTSGLNAEIVTELITSGQAGHILSEKKRLLTEANRLFEAYFPDAPRNGHPLSFFRWLPMDAGSQGLRCEEAFQKAGVRVFHSNRFLTGPADERSFLRVSLSGTTSLEQLERGLVLLRKALTEMHPTFK